MKNLLRPHRAFQYWVGRLALCGILALVVMPTAGRLQAAAGVRITSVADGAAAAGAGHQAGGHEHHRATAADHRAPDAPRQRHAGQDDCAYCPLLTQLAGAASPVFLLTAPPTGAAPSLTAAIGHAARRPHGLHARGPPTPA